MGAAWVQNTKYPPPKRGEPEIHRAARLGDHEAIRRLAAAGADLDQFFDIGLDPGALPHMVTPLMVAAGTGDGGSVETMRLLLDLGATWASCARMAVGGLGWNYGPGGDEARLRLCLALGSDPNEALRGATLLAMAARTGDAGRVRLLLDAGATTEAARVVWSLPASMRSTTWVDTDTPFSWQIPLHNAVESDAFEVVELLLAAGAEVGTRDSSGQTALFLARSLAVARLLIDAGLDLEDTDRLGWQPLLRAIFDGSIERVQAVIAAGANVHATHDRGFTVFMSAAASNERDPTILRALVEAGADPHAISDLGWNAFHAAVDVNEASCATTFAVLAQLGVDIDHRDHDGLSPLGRSVRYALTAEIAELVRLGAKL